MDSITRQLFYFLTSIIVITGFVMVITTAFNFLNIEFHVYGSYLIWFIALFLFYWILPSSTGDIFMGELKL
jgi:hypothetical protein